MSSDARPRLRSLIGDVVGACTRKAWLVILAAAIVCGAALVYTQRHIAIDTDSAKLISEDVPWRKRESAFAAAFPHRADLIAVVVDGSSPELAEAATAALSRQLSAQKTVFHEVWRPDGGSFFDRAGLLFGSTAEVTQTTTQLIAAQPLLGTLAADPSLRGLMQALSLVADGARLDPSALNAFAPPIAKLANAFEAIDAGQTPPFSWRLLIAQRDPEPRELRRFILVHPVLDYTALQPGGRATEAIRQSVHALALDADPRLLIRLTGGVPLADEEFETLADGAALNAAATMAAVVILLWLALRSWQLIIAIVSSLIVGLLVTSSLGLLAFGTLNLISVAFAVLFVGLGVDFGIQFCVCYRAKRYAGGELAPALRDAGAEVGTALALAAASIATGFYAFLPTEYRGVSELGVIAGTGMIVAFVSSITLLPAIIAVLRPSAERAPVGYAAFAPLDHFVARHRRWVLACAGVAAVFSAAMLPALQFDFNPLHLRSIRTESVATLLDLMRDPDTTPNTVDILAPSLGQAGALAQRVERLPEVDHALTLASFVPEHQQEKLALISDAALLLEPVLNPAEVRPPPSDQETIRSLSAVAQRLDEAAAANPRAAVARDAMRLARALRSLARGEPGQRQRASSVLIPGLADTLAQLRSALQAEPVTLETLPEDLVRDWVAPDGRARIEVFPKGGANDNEALQRFVAAVQRLAPDATGAPVSIQESSRTIMRAFIQAGIWALVSIAVLLSIALRRAVDVLLTLTPLILAGLLTLGLCSAMGMPLNFENIIALPLLIGIGVAFNIYFVMAWRSGAVNLLQSSLTRAILFSALTTGTAFGSLWLSQHPGTSSMGKLLALSLACTLLVALLFLPALLQSIPARRGSAP